MESYVKKPVSVILIGWFFIIISIVMILSNGFVLAALIFSGNGASLEVSQEILPAPFRIFSSLFQYFTNLDVIQLVLGCFIFFSAIQFLKLRAWARRALEIVAWLSLVYSLGFGSIFLFSLISIGIGRAGTNGGELPLGSQIMHAASGIFVLLLISAPAIVIIKLLRGKPIRSLFTNTSNKQSSTTYVETKDQSLF